MSWFIYLIVTSGACLLYKKQGLPIDGRMFIVFAWALICGLLIDFIGGKIIGWWNYPRHKIGSKSYFIHLPLAWGIFGIQSFMIFRTIEVHLSNSLLAFIITSLVTSLLCEGEGYLRNIWAYKAPILLIIFGWFILILTLCGVPRILLF
jgi:hypothetical protein